MSEWQVSGGVKPSVVIWWPFAGGFVGALFALGNVCFPSELRYGEAQCVLFYVGRSRMKYLRRKMVGGVLLIAFLPVLLVVAVRVADAAARAVIELLGLIIPYVVVVVVLVGVYRLVLGRGRR